MQCLVVAISSADELVQELSMEQLFEASGEFPSGRPATSGISVILAALNSVNDHGFHTTASKTLMHAATHGEEIDVSGLAALCRAYSFCRTLPWCTCHRYCRCRTVDFL